LVYNIYMENKLIIIDGNSIAYRAFYGLPLLKNKQGEYTNAIFGFLNMMLKSISELKPTHIVVVFDYPLKENFRTELYKEYKGTRKPMPDELKEQMPKLNELIESLGITIFQEKGVEADDVIGTIAKKFNENTIIITGDRDALQLIDNSTSVLLTKRGLTDTLLLTSENFFEHYGFDPINIVDLKSIMGDASDNIPGVKGIGEKGANDLITRFRTLENVYSNLDKVSTRNKTLLTEQKEMADLSKILATINTNVDIKNIKFDDLKLTLPFDAKAKKLFEKYEFNSLLKNTKVFGENAIVEENNLNKPEIESNEVKIENDKHTTILLEEILDIKNYVSNFNSNKLSFIMDNEKILLAKDTQTECKITLRQSLIDDGLSLPEVLREIKPLLENENIKKLCFNYKALKHSLKEFDINFCGIKEDAKIASWLVSSSAKDEDIQTVFLNFGLISVSSTGLIKICDKLKIEQEKKDLRSLYTDIELQLTDILFEMENNGIKVDDKVRAELEEFYINKTEELENKIFEYAGEKFNLKSPKQVGEIFYTKMGLGDATWDTSIQTLKYIENRHPIVKCFIEYRKYIKLLSTYIIPFKVANKNANNLIHTTFNQTGTITGRLSSLSPNMQNIPARSSEGREVRKMFVSRFNGGELVSADYNQIELRLLAHYSKDKTLVDNYLNNEDVHQLTASQIFNVPYNQVTKEQRKQSKAVNFGIIYGISSYGLSEQIGVSPKEAGVFIENYYKHFSSVQNYLDGIVLDAINNNGVVETLMGRKRIIRELFDKNKLTQKFGERAAKNFPFQGSASDIIKVAMINITKRLKEENFKSCLCLQIHDELVFDCVKEEIDKVKQLAKEEMEKVIKLRVPLIANVGSGRTLFDI